MIQAFKTAGKDVGVYSSQYEWGQTMGSQSACTSVATGIDFWYANYNDVANFDDFVQVGGWTSAVMKQYKGTTYDCTIGVDLDYRP
jgi:hypothetical protein